MIVLPNPFIPGESITLDALLDFIIEHLSLLDAADLVPHAGTDFLNDTVSRVSDPDLKKVLTDEIIRRVIGD